MMSEHNENKNGVGDDLQKLVMAGLGAIVHLKEKSAKWVDEMAEKGKESAQDMQPVIDEMAQKGKEALHQGKAFGADAINKLQKVLDGIKEDVRQMNMDDVSESLNGLTDDALNSLRAQIDDLITRRDADKAEEAKCECEPCEAKCECGCEAQADQPEPQAEAEGACCCKEDEA